MRHRIAIVCFIALACAVRSAAAQVSQESQALLDKGNALLDALPEVPSDLREESFYIIEEKDKRVGWKQIRLDTVEKRGESFYRYRARYGIDSATFGWAEGEMMVLLDRKFTPVDIRNEMFYISPESGKRLVDDRARIKNKAFRRKLFDGRQTIKQKFDLENTRVVMLLEPLVGRLKLEEGAEFATINYEIFTGKFHTTIFEVDEPEDGKTKLKMQIRSVVTDPNSANSPEIESPPVAIEVEGEDGNSRTKKEEYYMLIRPDKSLHYMIDPAFKLETKRSDAETVEEVRKELVVETSELPLQ